MTEPLELTVRRPVPECRLRLLALPFAGGSSAMTIGWQEVLPVDVELVDVDLPARGGRIREAPIASLPEYLERLELAHDRQLTDRPLAIYGHSLGAVVGFELAARLEACGRPPTSLLVSGHRAPHLRSRRVEVHRLPRQQFIEALRELRGTPDELLEHPELMDLMLPAVRADFAISETYRYAPRPPLTIPIAVMTGRDDPEVPVEHAAAWACHTDARCTVDVLPGEHFFPITHRAPFLDRLAALLEELSEEGRAPRDPIAEP